MCFRRYEIYGIYYLHLQTPNFIDWLVIVIRKLTYILPVCEILRYSYLE